MQPKSLIFEHFSGAFFPDFPNFLKLKKSFKNSNFCAKTA